jgi:predicted PurR-regulated permease PerM
MTQQAGRSLPDRNDLVRAALVLVAVLIALFFIWKVRVLILLTALGVLLGIAAKTPVDWLERRRVPRHLGAPFVVLGLVLVLAAGLLISGPTLVDEWGAFKRQVPEAIDKLDTYLARDYPALLEALLPRDTADMRDSVSASASRRLRTVLVGQASAARGMVFGAVTSTLVVMAGAVYVLFLTIYFAWEPHVYRRGVLLLVPLNARDRTARLFDAITTTLRKWLGTQFIAMVVIGAATTVALLILRVKSALPLGILAGLLEFVPNIGPILSAVPAVLIAFAESPQKALVVGLVYWGIQFVENNFLIPWLMREELDLPPALTLMWQSLMAIVFGLLGLFVAVPLLAAGYVAVRFLYVRGDVPPIRRPRGSREVPTADIPVDGPADE